MGDRTKPVMPPASEIIAIGNQMTHLLNGRVIPVLVALRGVYSIERIMHLEAELQCRRC